MNKICRYVVAWVILLSLVLTSCATGGSGGSADPSADKTCQEGVCAKIDITQPIVLNRPANVTITISSTVDKPGLLVHLQVSPTNVTFGSDTDWHYDAAANQSKVFTSTVTLALPGEYMVAAEVFETGGPLVQSFKRVVIDSNGAVINPPIEPRPTWSGHPIDSPPPPEVLTATAEAQPTIIEPTKPPVEGFTAQQWLEKCGWTVKESDTLSLWPDVSGGLVIKETAIVGEQVTGTLMIGFKDIAHPAVPIQARIGLCTLGQGWTTDASHEWSTELRSATPFATPVSLHFTDVGEQPIFIVVLDTKNNRIAGIGRLIYVKPKEQGSGSQETPSAMDNTNSDSQAVMMAASPQWRLVASEAFNSSIWPSGAPLWRVNDLTRETPTDLDRKWGVRQSDLAAWPAAGGAAGLINGENYPNSYSSEMILGPIDTNGVAQAKVNFRMLLNTEPNYDFIRLYSSHDGNGWTERYFRSGTNGGWSSYDVDVSGDISTLYPILYLKWVFSSDSTNYPLNYNYTGIWVDDVSIWFLPGTVTISGTVTYTDRDGAAGRPAGYFNIQAWDRDKDNSWNFLEEKAADANGHYQFDPRENWDDDPGDTDHRLDLFLVYESVYNKGDILNEQIVTDLGNLLYRWNIQGNYVRWNVPNGTFNTSDALPPDPDIKAKAAYLFEDILHAYWSSPGYPGPARVRWQKGITYITILGTTVDSALFIPLLGPNGVFIPDKTESVDSQDVVVHETAHEYMANSNQFWYPLNAEWDTYQACVANQHHFFDITTNVCAYTEGWADFVAVVINQSFQSTDNCFDFSPNHCGAGSQNIEDPHLGDGQPTGDTVECRIAGSLWDLYDATNEGYDRSHIDLASIWAIQRGTGGFSLAAFWSTWSGASYSNGVYNKHNAVQTLYQNAIDYDHAPVANPISNISVLQGGVLDNAVDLWGGAFSDVESAPSEMTYSIVNISTNCGAQVDTNHYIDIDLRTNPFYLGSCSVTVRANDGIKIVDNVFQEIIHSIAGRNYITAILSNSGSSGGAGAASQPPSAKGTDTSTSDPYPAPMDNTNTDTGTQPEAGTDNNPYPSPTVSENID